jgi:hypothetical protein
LFLQLLLIYCGSPGLVVNHPKSLSSLWTELSENKAHLGHQSLSVACKEEILSAVTVEYRQDLGD